ncbi:hypothetical protein [Nocardioides sp.]|uniref:hypothetical protein n=1 Tax=Nocardioides sp. TaxID=35761 RepID=UPI00271AB640|nr:hypothetical protein [Nocardioides sp.]MDO9455444.1 hypothetical protein [Nocardioides sp.]
MKLARKLSLTLAATAVATSMIGLAAPAAHAGDSSWGCGGQCRGTVSDDDTPPADPDPASDTQDPDAP